jgi:hypothetical protein
MPPERARTRAWHIDQNRIHRSDRRVACVADKRKEVRHLQPLLIGEQSLESPE